VRKKRCDKPRGLCHVGCARMAGRHRNKDDCCVSGGDRTGVIFILAPGSPPCVLVSLAVCS
jgi:hypothetical protein